VFQQVRSPVSDSSVGLMPHPELTRILVNGETSEI
jgi:hypothetical protein